MTSSTGSLERLLRRDSASVVASLILITMLAWIYLIVLALDMAGGDMSLMAMDMSLAGSRGGIGEMATAMILEPQPWTWLTFVLMLLMWWVMMIGMMVPSAAPMILLFARLQRQKLSHENPGLRIALFTSGYVLMWLVFSAAATTAQWVLGELALLSPMMKSTSPILAAAIFAVAGIYQLTTLKQACLAHCQAPVHFLSAQWRKGDLGAFLMGLHHGAYCVGCCWFLMALLFAGGVMNLLWVAVIAAFVLLEKAVPKGFWVTRISGPLMLGFSALIAFRALTDTF